MEKYRICLRVADSFGATMEFEAVAGIPYDTLAKAIRKERLAELLCLPQIGYGAEDIEIITPEEYSEEFGDDDG